jgi:hypothetical protein
MRTKSDKTGEKLKGIIYMTTSTVTRLWFALLIVPTVGCVRHIDGIHRYQRGDGLGPLDAVGQYQPFPVTCWADSHPGVDWAARSDGNCFAEDAPWRKR